jgi:hypothetical protein
MSSKLNDSPTSDDASDIVAASILQNLKDAKAHAKHLSQVNAECFDIYRASGCKRAPNCILKISTMAINEFEALGFKTYLARSSLKESTKTMVQNMFAQFISFVKERFRNSLPKSANNTKTILLWLIDCKRHVFGEYTNSLGSSASNIVSRIEAIIHAVSFLDTIHSGNATHQYSDAIRVLQLLRTQYFKSSTADRKASNDTDNLIRACAYPKGGLREIREHLNDGWGYFDALVAAAQANYRLSESEYLECMRYVLATLWGYDNNARDLAIGHVCVDKVDKLSNDGHDFILSNHFKTFEQYQYQTISFSQIVKDIWIPIIRAQVAGKTGCRRLFINFRGNPISDNEISKHVHCFFLRYGLVINVTTLRKVLESAYAEAEANDLIDADARYKLTKAQGHTDETAQQYYVVGAKAAESVIDAVKNRDAFRSVVNALNMEDEVDIASRVETVQRRQSVFEGALDNSTFGDNWHGEITAGGTRFQWTEAELGWLEEWFLHMPLGTPNRYSACLHDIYIAPKAVKAIFHPHHVLNSDRLKTGAQRVEARIKRLLP